MYTVAFFINMSWKTIQRWNRHFQGVWEQDLFSFGSREPYTFIYREQGIETILGAGNTKMAKMWFREQRSKLTLVLERREYSVPNPLYWVIPQLHCISYTIPNNMKVKRAYPTWIDITVYIVFHLQPCQITVSLSSYQEICNWCNLHCGIAPLDLISGRYKQGIAGWHNICHISCNIYCNLGPVYRIEPFTTDK